MTPRKLLRIAWWEVTRNAGGIDRRTLAVAFVILALFGLVTPLLLNGGVGLDDGLYRVGIDESSPYYPVVADDETFVVRPGADRADLRNGDVELLFEGATVQFRDNPKSLAAYGELRGTVERFNNEQLRLEENGTAAFPVSVLLEYRQRGGVGDSPRIEDDDAGDGAASDGTGPDDDGEVDDAGPGDDPGSGDGEETDGTGDPTDGGGSGTGGTGDRGPSLGGDSGGGLGGISGPLSDDQVSGSPADISPPFPFQSLVLAFLFVIPLNFLIQAYGSAILSERINRRGELLLVSPVSRFDIIGGKTLPYFLGGMALESVIAIGLFVLVHGELGGVVSLLAVAPLVLLFLGATFLGAMFARSFKELTFVTVTITVTLTSYAFVPAIFTDVGAVALISPLTLVVRDLQNEAITLGEFTFSTAPPLLCSGVFFGLGAGLYREEDMFDQRSLRGRLLDALVGPIPRAGGSGRLTGRLDPYVALDLRTARQYVAVGGLTAALIPFVFVVQLLAIALLFALGEISLILVLVVVAIIEEIAKSLHVYASFQHRRFEPGLKTALALGVASGVGFFLAEKIALLAQLVGLPELAVGEAGLQGGIVPGPFALTVALFLLAPLVLHVVTAAISAVGASRGKRQYGIALCLAMLVHLAYNLTVVMAVV